MVLEYYLLNLRKQDFVMTFFRTNGFENLAELVDRISHMKR